MPATIMTKILQLVAGGSSSGAHRRHAEKMVTILDLLCRSGLVVGASRERVAREGFGACDCVSLCTEEGCRRALMRPPPTDGIECATVCAICTVTWRDYELLWTARMLYGPQVPRASASERARGETMLMRC